MTVKGRAEDGMPTANLAVDGFVHCGMCLRDLDEGRARGESPCSYARLNVGFTEIGLQVWCVRHDVNVLHIDFQGHRHPATDTVVNVHLERKGRAR